MFCSSCGKEIGEGALFCTYCGARQAPVSPPAAPPAPDVPPAPVQQAHQPAGYPAGEADQPVDNPPVSGGNPPDPVNQPQQPSYTGYPAGPANQQQPQQPGYGGYPGSTQQQPVQGGYGGTAVAEKPKKKVPIVPIIVAGLAAVVVIAAVILKFAQPAKPDGGGADDSSLSGQTDGSQIGGSQTDGSGLNTGAPADAAARELLGYVDQAQALAAQADSEINALIDQQDAFLDAGDGAAVIDLYEQAYGVSAQLSSQLSDLRSKANGVSGLDEKLKYAGQEYFNMVCDPRQAYSDVWAFFRDFMPLALHLDARPLQSSSEDMAYYDELYDWYLSVREEYDAITSCPPCMQSLWERFGSTIDLNENIAQKLYLGIEYPDPLRLVTAYNLADRYDTVISLQLDELMGCLGNESNHIWTQNSLAYSLAEEMAAYAEMDQAARDRYEFENIASGEIYLDYDAIDTIYPALYNTYDAFLIIKTGCASGSRRILVEAEIPGLTQAYRESFTVDSAYTEIYIKPPALTGDLNLSSVKDAQLQLTISEQDGTILEAKTFPVTIKSKYDFDWYTSEYGAATQDNILCFLTPESPAIAQLKRDAIDQLYSMSGGNMEAFVGYQGNVWDDNYVGTYLQAASIMRALYENGVRYNADSFSLSGSNQHILFPEDVLAQRSGLCIETSLVVASALQSAGMHVYLVLPPGHAQVAVEIWNGRGDNTGGTAQYYLIETTALSESWNNQNVFVADANAILNEDRFLNESPITCYNDDWWIEYLTQDGAYIVDCDDINLLGMTPFSN